MLDKVTFCLRRLQLSHAMATRFRLAGSTRRRIRRSWALSSAVAALALRFPATGDTGADKAWENCVRCSSVVITKPCSCAEEVWGNRKAGCGIQCGVNSESSRQIQGITPRDAFTTESTAEAHRRRKP